MKVLHNENGFETLPSELTDASCTDTANNRKFTLQNVVKSIVSEVMSIPGLIIAAPPRSWI